MLAGTLTVPQVSGPRPAAILMGGSGPLDRDGTAWGHRPFAYLANQLSLVGLATLRVDSRGVGKSTGNGLSATLEDRAGDVLALVEYLREQPNIDSAKIGVIGHSEGALVAALATSQCPRIAFVVLMACPGLPLARVFLEQDRLIMQQAGATDSFVARMADRQQQIFDIIQRTSDDGVAAQRINKLFQEEPTRSDEEQQWINALLHPPIPDTTILLSGWFRKLLDFDPGPVLSQVKCPVLAVAGERDLQVPAAQNLAAIEEAIRAGGNSRCTIRSLPGLNHNFQAAPTGLPSEYAQSKEDISPVLSSMLIQWIASHVNGGDSVKET